MARFENYKALRNKVRKYETVSLVLPCIKRLHEISTKPIYETGGNYPWNLLYLVKIAFLEGGKNGRKIATTANINTALNHILELGNESTFLKGDRGSVVKFMRTMAFQQFWFQRQIAASDIARQLLIFDGNAGSKWSEELLTITGLNINNFLQMLVSAWSGFANDPDRIHISKGWFAPLGCDEATIGSFFRLVALSEEETRQLFECHYENTEDKLLQLTEQTPLKQYPFLQVEDKYYCYSPHVLQEKIKHAIYDTLKSKHGKNFTQEFGVLFESYINRLMDENKIPYIPEVRLKQIFKKKRVCDAVLELDDALVLIEVKGIEMHPYAQINPTNAVLTSQLKTNIVKSFEQIYEVGNLLNNTVEGRAILKSKEVFAIVVTYKEMYLSGGQDLWDEFIAEPLKEYVSAKNLDISCVPLGNIFFASVNSFEELVKVVISNGNMISKFLQKAAQENSNPKSKKFLFDMHLESYEKAPIPLLEEKFDSMIEELKAKLF